MNKGSLKNGALLLAGFFWFYANVSIAQGFLQMPEMREVPEYEKDTMLLDMDIPPVRDRNPDPEGGPRLNVKEFRVQGLVEFPKMGITREALIKRVESIRFDMMKEGELGKWGYSEQEISEIADLLADIEKETQDSHVDNTDLQRLVFLVRDQRRRRGITLGMIESVADVITRFYRENGFILAKAFIPEQEVRDGVVTLTLLLGKLGEVEVLNNKRVSEKLIVRAFNPQIENPVTSKRMEESLYLVSDIPGLTVQSLLVPGSQVGDTKLQVSSMGEEWYSGNIRFDNHGSQNTSENRAYADFYLHNPLGWGDELYLAVLNSFSPDNSTYGAFRYNSMWGMPRLRTSIGFSTNDFVSRDVRNSGERFFTGKSEVADVSLKYLMKRSRIKNYSVEVRYMDIDTTLDTSATITDEKAKKTSLGFNFDLLSEKRRQVYIGNVSLHRSDTYESGGFDGTVNETENYLTFDFNMLAFMNFPFTEKQTRWLIKTSGQYAGEALSNLNQINLTGPARTRAFGVNGLQTDDGLFLGVDWIFGFPSFGNAKLFGESIGHIIQPYVFIDGAYGEIHPLIEGDEKITGELANAGVGLKLQHRHFSANFTAASVIRDNVKDLQNNTPTSEVYAELSFHF
ncbi:ShlB/FhaC/HecB family hemolysin secretion/activation protein [Teredinibacter sp. KSP-S5-2]|uniref:ShlB/FhaC/HecB family hemolysin secretion/activation protein n=1 Tax=Teredinibacter sp. KSP-S5-2 TaxID=3034506 RepID=UPI00293479F0|nr:ShlB/FhaC/HecB family hemolysin secretion/activation protein [Teredinibacter sp. KSP-S5-2]WNO10473.1 ShlB/FhaC/HecB family hemolysin secretion/activation protein [Teredinibacter sp. KSP-S5-2]